MKCGGRKRGFYHTHGYGIYMGGWGVLMLLPRGACARVGETREMNMRERETAMAHAPHTTPEGRRCWRCGGKDRLDLFGGRGRVFPRDGPREGIFGGHTGDYVTRAEWIMCTVLRQCGSLHHGIDMLTRFFGSFPLLGYLPIWFCFPRWSVLLYQLRASGHRTSRQGGKKKQEQKQLQPP